MFTKLHPEHVYHPDWPEARWNISGLLAHRVLVRVFVEQLKRFKINTLIESFHDAPNLVWNGGRPNRDFPLPSDPAAYFKALNDDGIGILFTFTNTLIEKRHLDDRNGNSLLDCLDENCGLNGVIVVSDLLSDHIRSRKPKLRQVSSVLKSFFENPEGKLAWYKLMEGRFDQVVIHPDHLFEPDLIAGLDRNKAEILVNEPCFHGCPHRRYHQTMISRWNMTRDGEAQEKISELVRTRCLGMGNLLDEGKNPGHGRSCTLSRSELQALHAMGFRKFKISGRQKPSISLAWHMIHYMINPDLAYLVADNIYKSFDLIIKEEFRQVKNPAERKMKE
ncbi:MAG: hypothetical protein V1706_00715 [Pseudomonadota bacterium]